MLRQNLRLIPKTSQAKTSDLLVLLVGCTYATELALRRDAVHHPLSRPLASSLGGAPDQQQEDDGGRRRARPSQPGDVSPLAD